MVVETIFRHDIYKNFYYLTTFFIAVVNEKYKVYLTTN